MMTSMPEPAAPVRSPVASPSGAAPGPDTPPGIDGLRIIALFKYAKALLLIITSYGVHKLLDPALVEKIRLWSATLTDRVDQRLILRALSWVEGLGANRLQLVVAVGVAYTVVVLVEATGLWLRRQWGKWFTVLLTASLIPFEVWDLWSRPPGRRLTVIATLTVNIIILAYLIYVLRTGQQRRKPLETD
jgi:uncharacterized membrane protein (DUF2068 family)